MSLSSSFSIYRIIYSFFYKINYPGIYSFDDISVEKLSFEYLYRSSEVLFFKNISFISIWRYPPIIFFLFKILDAFLIWQFNSFRCFSFLTFHYAHGTFSNTKFLSFLLVIHSYCLHQGLLFVFIFSKYLDLINLHERIKLSCDFVNW